jgi:hypothetical protein
VLDRRSRAAADFHALALEVGEHALRRVEARRRPAHRSRATAADRARSEIEPRTGSSRALALAALSEERQRTR